MDCEAGAAGMRETRLREASATRTPRAGAAPAGATETPARRASSVAAVISPGVAAAGWKMEVRDGRDEAVMGVVRGRRTAEGRTVTASGAVSK